MTGLGYDTWVLVSGLVAGLACGFLNTVASSGSAVSLPILLMIGLDPVSANATNRVPVLIGALSATWSFHRRQVLLWNLGLKVSIPIAIGALGGAILAEILPARHLALIITAAVLVAFVLLFTKLKQAIEAANSDVVRYGLREFLVFVVIAAWLGFIVLDGATYLLLALTLIVGLPLIQANAIKSALLIPSTIIAMLVFAYRGHLNWTLGAVMGAGSIAGGVLGARLATSPQARKWVFVLLVVVLTAELVQLTIHYAFKTH